MGVEMGWLINGQVLKVSFSGVLNDASIQQTIEQRKSLILLQNNTPIHTIIDFRHIDTFELGIDQLSHLIGNLPQFCKSGFLIGLMDVESNLFLGVQFAARLSMYQMGMKFQICTTLQEAVQFLKMMDREINREDLVSVS
jgi:hypothetical protein